LLSRSLNTEYIANIGLVAAIQLEVDRINHLRRQKVHWDNNANGRLTYQGGDHYTPLNYAATMAGKEVVADERNAYAQQLPATLTAHLTASFKINRNKLSHEIALKVINISGTPDFYGYQYNYKTNAIDKHEEVIFIPNLSYRIDF
jgi:hypothetical protein